MRVTCSALDGKAVDLKTITVVSLNVNLLPCCLVALSSFLTLICSSILFTACTRYLCINVFAVAIFSNTICIPAILN